MNNFSNKINQNCIIFQSIFKIEKAEHSLLFIKLIFPLNNREKTNTGEIHLESEINKRNALILNGLLYSGPENTRKSMKFFPICICSQSFGTMKYFSSLLQVFSELYHICIMARIFHFISLLHTKLYNISLEVVTPALDLTFFLTGSWEIQLGVLQKNM